MNQAPSESVAAERVAKFIASNLGSAWHLGRRMESRGARTGKLMAVYYVTACSGRRLGGAWGQTEVDELPERADVCPRCAKLLAASEEASAE